MIKIKLFRLIAQGKVTNVISVSSEKFEKKSIVGKKVWVAGESLNSVSNQRTAEISEIISKLIQNVKL